MKRKIIRDTIHGYIKIDKDDLLIIDHPLFQRLLRIRQGLNQAAYPTTNHSRFEHSLGVMDLGTNVLAAIKQTTTLQGVKKKFEEKEREVRFACLLHDIGQPPLSHIGEIFFDKQILINKLCKLYNRNNSLLNQAKNHELMSAIIILHNKGLRKILDRLNLDVEFMADMITGYYVPYIGKPELALIQILYSQIDVDRLDYLLRDNFMAGGDFISIDVPRIIQAYLYSRKSHCLVMNYTALSTITNFIYGRSNIYSWVINHHRNVLFNGMHSEFLNELIEKEKKRKILGIPPKITNLEQFFTIESIIEHRIDDIDILGVLKANKDISDNTKLYYKHIFERGSLSPVWKTGIDFDSHLNNLRDKTLGSAIKEIIFQQKDLPFNRIKKMEDFFREKLSIPENVLIFAFKSEDRHYEVEFTKGVRDNFLIQLRNGKEETFEVLFESKFIKSPAIYPFLYLDKNDNNYDHWRKSIESLGS